ncbi:MAG: hypothetical protein RLZZ458_411 [Planctomycetota bacterium]
MGVCVGCGGAGRWGGDGRGRPSYGGGGVDGRGRPSYGGGRVGDVRLLDDLLGI